MKLRVVLVAAGVAAGIAGAGMASGSAPTTFRECAFVEAGWMPDHAPPVVPKKYEKLTPVPEGWTVVGGNTATTPAILVCR